MAFADFSQYLDIIIPALTAGGPPVFDVPTAPPSVYFLDKHYWSSACKLHSNLNSALFSESPSYGFGNRPQLLNKDFEFFGSKALGSVGKSIFRVRMNFYDQPISSGGYCRFTDGSHVFPFSRPVTGIDYNREVAQGFEHRELRLCPVCCACRFQMFVCLFRRE